MQRQNRLQAEEPRRRLEEAGRGRRSPDPVLELREESRAWNRAREHLAIDWRCECGRASCREALPAAAKLHRGMGDRFIVAPDHAGDGMVVKVADRFFVVELNARPTRFRPLAAQMSPSIEAVPALRAPRPRLPAAKGSKPIEIVAPDGYCAALLLEHAAPLFPAELISGPGWIVRLQPPTRGEWVPTLLSVVEGWLAAVPLPCAKVLFSGRSYLIRASPAR